MKKSHLSVREGIELLKQKCMRFTLQNNTVYIDIFPKILSTYNNSKHRSIGMTPKRARKPEKYGKAYFNLYGDLRRAGKPAFAIGDR